MSLSLEDKSQYDMFQHLQAFTQEYYIWDKAEKKNSPLPPPKEMIQWRNDPIENPLVLSLVCELLIESIKADGAECSPF